MTGNGTSWITYRHSHHGKNEKLWVMVYSIIYVNEWQKDSVHGISDDHPTIELITLLRSDSIFTRIDNHTVDYIG